MLNFLLSAGSPIVEWKSRDIITYLLIGALIISLLVTIIIFFNRPEYQTKQTSEKKSEPKKPDPIVITIEDNK